MRGKVNSNEKSQCKSADKYSDKFGTNLTCVILVSRGGKVSEGEDQEKFPVSGNSIDLMTNVHE